MEIISIFAMKLRVPEEKADLSGNECDVMVINCNYNIILMEQQSQHSLSLIYN